MSIAFSIKGELCDLNTYINIERRNRFLASKVKKEQTELVEWQVRALRLTPIVVYPVVIKLRWYTKNLKKDNDNVTFSKKFVADGLVQSGLLVDDSRKYVHLITDISIDVDASCPRVEVEIIPFLNV